MRTSLILSLLLATNIAGRSQTPREAVAAALHTSIPPERVSLPIEPMSWTNQTEWAVHSVRFDPTLRSWLMELRCKKPVRCVPVLATVNINDQTLLPAPSTRPKIVVRAGESKQLVANSGSIRISQAVTCLRSGQAGDRVPVRSRVNRQLQLAVVGADGTLSPWTAR